MGNLFPNSVLVSSVAPDGLSPLRSVLLETVRRFKPIVQLRIGLGDGKLLADLHRSGEVVSQRHTDEGLFVTARLDATTLGRVTRAGAVVVNGAPPLPTPAATGD
jgi:GTP-binding protein HflX